MKNRILIIAILLLAIYKSTSGQTVIWEVSLQSCTSLKEIAPNLYEIVKDGKAGVIDCKGEIIVPIENSEITGFHDGVALLLSGNKINGLLSSDGRYSKFEEDYYTLEGQEFFSDGYVTAMNKKKARGFIDFDGNPMGFDKKYTKIKPFTEGYAAVFLGNQYSLINKNLTPVKITIGVGTITRGTNMYNGTAIVWDSKGRAYEVTSSSTTENTKFEDKDFKIKGDSYDYLHRLICITNQSTSVRWNKIEKSDIMMSPHKNDAGKYGYENIIPCQFDEAEPFHNNLAIVKKDSQWGVLRFIPEDAPFELQQHKERYLYKEGEETNCTLRFISIPRKWQNQKLSYLIRDLQTNIDVADGTIINGEFNFKVPPKEEKNTYAVLVHSNNLQLLAYDISLDFKKFRDFTANINVINPKRANKNDQCEVKIILENPNDESKEAEITISGSTSLKSKKTKITLKAHGSQEIKTWFNVPQELRDQIIEIREDGKLIKREVIPSLKANYIGE